MKYCFNILILLIFLSSCGVISTQRNFSKRKHLSGHFRIKKSHLRSGDSKVFETKKTGIPSKRNMEAEVVSSTTNQFIEQQTKSPYRAKATEVEKSQKSTSSLSKEPSKTQSQIVLKLGKNQSAETIPIEATKKKSSSKRKAEILLILFYISLILLIIGLLLVIIGAVLQGLEIIGAGLLIVGAIIAGTSFIYLIINVMILFFALTRVDPLPRYEPE